jgi:hypothetical protein
MVLLVVEEQVPQSRNHQNHRHHLRRQDRRHRPQVQSRLHQTTHSDRLVLASVLVGGAIQANLLVLTELVLVLLGLLC